MTAIYVRQSVYKKDSISIESQIQLCKNEIKDGGEFKVYRDKGFSGKSINRPSFSALMQDVKSGGIERIIVYRLDRFSRSIADFGAVWQVLEKNGVEFISVNEKFDTTTPIGVAMLNIIMVFAQLERETIAERVKDNYYARAKSGAWTGGPAPYGFKLEKISLDGKRLSRLCPTESIETVKRIYSEYVKEGVSLSCVAKQLTAEEIPCASRKGWDSVAVSRILHNPVYAGCSLEIYLYFEGMGVNISNPVSEFDGKRGGMLVGKRNRGKGEYNSADKRRFSLALHSGVIKPELWLACNKKLDNNTQINNMCSGKHSWLTGLIKCGNCGYGIRVITDKSKRYLVCSGRTNYHICGESYASVDLGQIETAVLEEMFALFEGHIVESDEINSGYAEKKLEIDEKINRLMQALSQGTAVSIKYINRELERLENEKNVLAKSLGQKHTAKTISCSFSTFELSYEEKQRLAAELIEKIVVGDDEVNVFWRI